MMRLRRPIVSMEAIQFQNVVFFNELTEIFAEFAALDTRDLRNSGAAKKMHDLVVKRVNMNLQVHFIDSPDTAFIMVPVLDANHILFTPKDQEYFEIAFAGKTALTRAKAASFRGGIDLKTGKLTGDYANIKVDICVSMDFFNERHFTPEEAAAVMLHEIGHYASFVELMSRMVRFDHVMEGMAAALSTETQPRLRQSILINAVDTLGAKGINVEKLAAENNMEVSAIVLLKGYVEYVRDETGSDVFNMATWEHVADQYVSRLGGGRHLVTALAKIQSKYGSIETRSSTTYLFMEALKLTLTLSGVFTIFGLALLLADSVDDTYGRASVRLGRIREQLVTQLKDVSLPASVHESLTKDIDIIDETLKTYSGKRQLISYVASVIFAGPRKYFEDEQIAQELSALGSSDLFVQAAKYKQLAKAAS